MVLVEICFGVSRSWLYFTRPHIHTLWKRRKVSGEPPRAETLKALFREPAFWVMVALFSFGISGLLGVYRMLRLYLVAGRNLQGSCANYIVGLSRISGLGTVFLSGMVTDRLGPKITMAGVLLGTGLLTLLLGVVSGPSIVVMVFLQPLLATWFFPSGFAALSRVGPKSVRNILISFTVPVASLIGAGAVPAGLGVLAKGTFSAWVSVCWAD